MLFGGGQVPLCQCGHLRHPDEGTCGRIECIESYEIESARLGEQRPASVRAFFERAKRRAARAGGAD